MGRVRRYKKIKHMDPFAKTKKKKGRKDDYDKYDLPPSIKNHVAQRVMKDPEKKRSMKRRLPKWLEENIKNTPKEGGTLAVSNVTAEVTKNRSQIEGKREDESFQQFNKRVRRETIQLLADDVKAHSASALKKKEYLQAKKKKQKLMKAGAWEEHQREEYLKSASESSGRMRTFAKAEMIPFGEVAHRPPNFSILPKAKGRGIMRILSGEEKKDPEKAKKPWLKFAKSHALYKGSGPAAEGKW